MNRTIHEAAAAIRRGELTPLDLLDECLARIDLLEEKVRAWAFLDRDGARADAERLTQELKQGQDRGPLHGIPIGIKDIIDVFDMPTGCGSKRWANSYARRDATVVQRLRQAGAVILGKTVTTAYASFDPPPTRNPWDLTRTPGGSSSGSAAAVACGMCLGALATQTGGSITRPASFCGVCSIKPSYERVSVDGVLPLAPSMDHVGAMANCVRDLALLLQPLARTESIHQAPAPYHYHAEIELPSVYQRERQLAVLPDFFPDRADREMAAMFANLRETTTKAGWSWNVLPLPPSWSEVPTNHHIVMGVEAAAYHADRMRRHPEDYPPRVGSLIESGLACSAPRFVRVLEHLDTFRDEVETAFADGLETFATPATVGPAPAADTTGDPLFNSPWSYAGLPTVSLPVAWTDHGLPLAVQLIGRRWCEDDVLAVAAMLEETVGFTARPIPL